MLRLSVAVAAAAALVTGLASAATVTGTSAGGRPHGNAARRRPRRACGEGHDLGPRRRRRHPRRARARHRSTRGAGDDRIPAHGDGLARPHPLRRRSRHRHGRRHRRRPARLRSRLAADLERPHERPDRSARDAGRARHVRVRLDHRLGVSDRARLRRRRGGHRLLHVARRGSDLEERACSPVSPTRLRGRARPSGRATPSSRTTPLHGTWLAATLGISERTSSYYLYVNRSQNGLTWSAPVAAVTGPTGDLDKEWITCDNGAASPFRGHCYLSYFHVRSGEIRTTTTTDGGVTWSHAGRELARASAGARLQRRAAARPPERHAGRRLHGVRRPALRRPKRDRRRRDRRTAAPRSRRPSRAALLSTAAIPAMRTFALASAEVDAAGRMYVVWEGCPGGGTCSASRIVMSTSVDGVSWTPAQSVTPAAAGGRPLPPGDRRQPGDSGRLALVFHSIPDDCANVADVPGHRRLPHDVDGRRPDVVEAAAAHRRADRARLDRPHAHRTDARRLRLDVVRPRPTGVGVRARLAARERPLPASDLRLPLAEAALRVGILTGGGDCPGLNAVIRAVVRRSAGRGERGRGRDGRLAGAHRRHASRSSGCARSPGSFPAAGRSSARRERIRTASKAASTASCGTSRPQRLEGLVAVGGEDTLGRRAVAVGRARPARRGRAEDDRQRPLGDRLHVRLRHRRGRLHGGHRPPAHDGRVAQPRDGRGGDGPLHGLDRRDERHRRRRGRDPHPRASAHGRGDVRGAREAATAARTSRSSSCRRATRCASSPARSAPSCRS